MERGGGDAAHERERRYLEAVIAERNELLMQKTADVEAERQRGAALEAELTDARGALDHTLQRLNLCEYDLREPPRAEGTGPSRRQSVPAIDGEVIAVRADGTVRLSVGADDRVEEGMHLAIRRKDRLLGLAFVERADRDSADCRVVLVASGSRVQEGDRAGTRLRPTGQAADWTAPR